MSPLIPLVLVVAVVGLFSSVTRTVASTWGHPELAATVWPQEWPRSVRVLQFAGDVWASQGQLHQAEHLFREGYQRNPDALVLLLQAVQMRCALGSDVSADVDAALELSRRPLLLERSSLHTMDRLRELALEQRCHGVRPSDLLGILRQLEEGSRLASQGLAGHAWFLRANLLRDLGRLEEALAALEESRSRLPDLRIRFWQVLWLLNAGEVESARTYLKLARSEFRQEPRPSRAKELQVLESLFEVVDTFRTAGAEIRIDPERIERGLAGVEISERSEGGLHVRLDSAVR